MLHHRSIDTLTENGKEIANELNQDWKTHSDTEVILEAFVKWGPDFANKLKFSIAIHPGETLKEVLKGENMSFIELSHKCKLSKSLIQDIVNGKADITEKVAEELEKVF